MTISRRTLTCSSLLIIWLSAGIVAAAEARNVSLVAKKFEWTPSRIEVKVGETIELALSSEDVKHGFVSKELGIEKVKFTQDQPASVRFTATEPGNYRFKCADFCGKGHRRMKGEIIVRP